MELAGSNLPTDLLAQVYQSNLNRSYRDMRRQERLDNLIAGRIFTVIKMRKVNKITKWMFYAALNHQVYHPIMSMILFMAMSVNAPQNFLDYPFKPQKLMFAMRASKRENINRTDDLR